MESNIYSPYNAKNRPLQKRDIEFLLSQHGLSRYNVKNVELFQKAMIHTTYVRRKDGYTTPSGQPAFLAPCPEGVMDLQEESYECLEFLGDSMLGASVSNYLWDRYPGEPPGFLTTLRKKIVNNKTLGTICQKIGLEKFYVISRHVEEACAGRANLEKLGDVMEAFLAALWEDCGRDFKLYHLFVSNLIEKHLRLTQLILNDDNYKDRFQKHCQQVFHYTPTYSMIASEDGEFTMAVQDPSGKHLGIGKATTKKQAEQNACKHALETLHLL
jgi:ribonuclease-3